MLYQPRFNHKFQNFVNSYLTILEIYDRKYHETQKQPQSNGTRISRKAAFVFI